MHSPGAIGLLLAPLAILIGVVIGLFQGWLKPLIKLFKIDDLVKGLPGLVKRIRLFFVGKTGPLGVLGRFFTRIGKILGPVGKVMGGIRGGITRVYRAILGVVKFVGRRSKLLKAIFGMSKVIGRLAGRFLLVTTIIMSLFDFFKGFFKAKDDDQ